MRHCPEEPTVVAVALHTRAILVAATRRRESDAEGDGGGPCPGLNLAVTRARASRPVGDLITGGSVIDRGASTAMPLVLVGGDPERATRSMERVLEPARCVVVRAATARRAVQYVRETRPDAIILDEVLPDANGPRRVPHYGRSPGWDTQHRS